MGCPMRCTFCATGKGGFARNLLPHEIVDQVLTVQEHFKTRVSNVGESPPAQHFLVISICRPVSCNLLEVACTTQAESFRARIMELERHPVELIISLTRLG